MGVMLFEMLSGRPPFTGTSAMSIVTKQMAEEPPNLAGAHKDAVMGLLNEVVQKALVKDPEARFPTMETLLSAFESAAREAGVSLAASVDFAPPKAAEVVSDTTPEVDGPTRSVQAEPHTLAEGAAEIVTGPVGTLSHETRRRALMVAGLATVAATVFVVLMLVLPGNDDARLAGGGDAAVAVAAGASHPGVGAGDPKAKPAVVVRTPSGRLPAEREEPASTPEPVVQPPVEKKVDRKVKKKRPSARARRPRPSPRPSKPAGATGSRSPPKQAAPRKKPPTAAQPTLVERRVAEAARNISDSLLNCRCDRARQWLGAFKQRGAKAKDARGWTRKVNACQTPDVDERCVRGKIVAR